MRCAVMAILAICVVAPAWAATPSSLPALVRKDVAQLDRDCRGYGGVPGGSPDLVQTGDISGDGVPDYVVSLGAYDCEGAASAMGAGQSGAGVTIYLGGPGGSAAQAYSATVYGAKIEAKGGKTRVMVDVGGIDCGQKNAARVAFAEMKFCTRPLNWNPATKTFVYAPLAEARPIQ